MGKFSRSRRMLWFVGTLFLAGWLEAGEIDPRRLRVDDQISKKSSNHGGSINDKRQDIGGFLSLQDQGSSLQPPLGGFKWKTILFGKPCGRGADQGEWVVLSAKEGEGDLPLQGRLRMDVEPIATVYDKVGSGNYGYEYFGYAVVVRSSLDPNVVVVKTDKRALEQSPEKYEDLKGGELLDKSWKVVRRGIQPSEGIRR